MTSSHIKDYTTFLARVKKLKGNTPSLRIGQIILNEISLYRPVLSDKLRGSSIDPFYCDQWDKCAEGLKWIEENFESRFPSVIP